MKLGGDIESEKISTSGWLRAVVFFPVIRSVEIV